MSAASTSAGAQTGFSERYASAFFELAQEAGGAERAERDLQALSALMVKSEDLRAFLKSPVYDAESKSRAIATVAERAGLSALTRNFLAIVAKNRRLFALEAIIASFFDRLSRHRGEVSAEAISSSPLNDDQERRLRGEIEAIVGKAVNLRTRVDPELLGGLVVKVGSTMIDSSLRTKLNRLKTKMKEA